MREKIIKAISCAHTFIIHQQIGTYYETNIKEEENIHYSYIFFFKLHFLLLLYIKEEKKIFIIITNTIRS